MIGWTDVEAASPVQDLRLLLRRLSLVDTIGVVSGLGGSALVRVVDSCWSRIHSHATGSRVETGGLLLGEIFRPPWAVPEGAAHLVLVERAVPSPQPTGTATSLRMDAGLWGKARWHLDHGLAVVGWYHTHPGLGVFFSATDRNTQRAFFAQPYSVGLVIDPVSGDAGCFVGAGCRMARDSLHLVPDEALARVSGRRSLSAPGPRAPAL